MFNAFFCVKNIDECKGNFFVAVAVSTFTLGFLFLYNQ